MTKSSTVILIFKSLCDLIVLSFLLKTFKLRAKEKKKKMKRKGKENKKGNKKWKRGKCLKILKEGYFFWK